MVSWRHEWRKVVSLIDKICFDFSFLSQSFSSVFMLKSLFHPKMSNPLALHLDIPILCMVTELPNWHFIYPPPPTQQKLLFESTFLFRNKELLLLIINYYYFLSCHFSKMKSVKTYALLEYSGVNYIIIFKVRSHQDKQVKKGSENWGVRTNFPQVI